MKSKLPVKSEMPFYLSMAYIVFAQHDLAKVNNKANVGLGDYIRFL